MYSKEEFITRIDEQIASEQKYSALLDESPKKFAASKKVLMVAGIIFVCAVILSIIRYQTIETVLLVWIASVYLLYMVNFVLMMLPSFGTDADIQIIDKPIPELLKDFLRLANLIKTVNKNKVSLIEFFWNAFIINTKAIARPFSILFLTNVFCAAVLLALGKMDWITFVLLAAQTGVILLMYYKIVKAVPGTPGFFTHRGIPVEHMGFAKGIVVWLSIGIFSVLTIFILVGAMMFPGLTFEGYLADVSTIPWEYPIMLGITIVFLYLWMRYRTGIDSVTVMRGLNSTHLSILQNDLLPKVREADGVELAQLKRRFVLLSMNKLLVQEFFLRFPVYVLMPNIVIVADKVSQEILNDAKDEKSLKDLL